MRTRQLVSRPRLQNVSRNGASLPWNSVRILKWLSLSVALAVACAGCAAGPKVDYEWKHTTKTEQAFSQDHSFCTARAEKEALESLVTGEGKEAERSSRATRMRVDREAGPGSGASHEMQEKMAKKRAYQKCMTQKGWRKVKKEEDGS